MNLDELGHPMLLSHVACVMRAGYDIGDEGQYLHNGYVFEI
jgi:hypothetical protein